MSDNIQHAATATGDKHEQQARMEDRFGPFIQVLQKQVSHLLGLYPIGNIGAVVGKASNVTGDELYELYLNSFEDEQVRQDHKCRCCKDFFRRFGTLIQLTKDGQSHALLFQDSEEVPELYRPFVRAAAAKLTNARIDTVLTAQRKKSTVEIGEAHKGGFEHFHFELNGLAVRAEVIHDTYQAGAHIREDVRLLTESFGTWTLPTLNRAKQLFAHDERLARTQWRDVVPDFMDVREFYKELKNHNIRYNYTVVSAVSSRKAVARIGQTVVGEFLSKLQGISDEKVAIQHFLSMTNSADYMRPVAAPAAATVARAEAIFAELELAPSLERRAMRRDELTTFIWQPTVVETAKPAAGVFGHVVTDKGTSSEKTATAEPIQGGKVSVAKLADLLASGKVLGLEVMVPGGMSGAFSSLTTAVNPDARPILRWDDDEQRNPACGYHYVQPVHPSTWGLHPYNWEKVYAVVPDCKLFGKTLDAAALRDLHFVLENGYDHHPKVSLPLFPETLRAELHEVRSVIEAYARTGKLQDVEKGLAMAEPMIGLKVRVDTGDTKVVYEIGSVE